MHRAQLPIPYHSTQHTYRLCHSLFGFAAQMSSLFMRAETGQDMNVPEFGNRLQGERIAKPNGFISFSVFTDHPLHFITRHFLLAPHDMMFNSVFKVIGELL